MNMKFKKIAACLMATASLATSMVGLGANAATATDSNSKFDYYRDSMSAECTLTNTTQQDRYAQVSMTIYTADGTKFASNYNPSLGYWEELSRSYDSPKVITGVVFYGTLYYNTQPVGTPISSWHYTL